MFCKKFTNLYFIGIYLGARAQARFNVVFFLQYATTKCPKTVRVTHDGGTALRATKHIFVFI